jgi:hypothetical protein
MSITEFWAVIDFILNMVSQFFITMDAVVIVDDPRFSLFNFAVSVIFLSLLIHTINWLRGMPPGRIFASNEPQVMNPQMQNYRPPDDNLSREMWEYGKK